jgi:hypothetical protein
MSNGLTPRTKEERALAKSEHEIAMKTWNARFQYTLVAQMHETVLGTYEYPATNDKFLTGYAAAFQYLKMTKPKAPAARTWQEFGQDIQAVFAESSCRSTIKVEDSSTPSAGRLKR